MPTPAPFSNAPAMALEDSGRSAVSADAANSPSCAAPATSGTSATEAQRQQQHIAALPGRLPDVGTTASAGAGPGDQTASASPTAAAGPEDMGRETPGTAQSTVTPWQARQQRHGAEERPGSASTGAPCTTCARAVATAWPGHALPTTAGGSFQMRFGCLRLAGEVGIATCLSCARIGVPHHLLILCIRPLLS